ncbi:MAG: efflux RND transporter periplasmic adaptor subunit [Synergistaceae bacterium]|jgi:HlyD family secretion protein|nr:efflux RND transporter periplasmic adaptor subunit [Synergistaceae bacterium]
MLRKLVILAVLVGVGWGVWYAFYRKVPPAYELRTEKTDKGNITATVTASGRLNAVSVVEVGTQVSGTIREIYVDYNSPVKEGQLIALLDPAVLRSQLVESRASLEVAEAGVGSAAASLTDAQRKLKRGQELYARRLIARSELEDAETSVLLKRAQLQEARARVTQAKATVERARTNLDYTRVTSPVDGVIVSRQVDVGQTVAASFQTPTLFSIARDLTQMQIDASVDEADIGRVFEKQEAEFYVDAFPSELFKGKVAQVRIAPATADNVVTYTVVIRVDNPGLRLKPGMTANVSVKTGTRQDVLRIPTAALRFRPPRGLTLPPMSVDAGSENPSVSIGSVWLVQDGQLTRRIRVMTGIDNGNRVEVLSGDVKEGDDLAVTAIPTTRSRRLF